MREQFRLLIRDLRKETFPMLLTTAMDTPGQSDGKRTVGAQRNHATELAEDGLRNLLARRQGALHQHPV